MPSKVTLPDVLYQVYIWGGLDTSEETERPISYNGFKKVMLGSELLVNEKSIRLKYEQILAAGYAVENRNNPKIIVLDVAMIRRALILEHRIAVSKQGAHTHTHTKGAHTQGADAEVGA